MGFDGSAIEGFARVYESDMLAHPDPATFQVLPWRDRSPATARMFCDISMPDGSPSYADPRYVLKRSLKKAADSGFTFYTHPEVEFFLFKDPLLPGVPPEPVDQVRLLRPHPAEPRQRFPAQSHHHAGADGDLGGVLPPRGWARPAGDRPALRRRPLHRGQSDDVPGGGQGGGALPGHPRLLHAQAVHPVAGFGHAHPHVAVRGRQQRLLRRGGGESPVQGGALLHRRPAAARRRDHRGHQPVGQLLQAARRRR